MKTQTPIRAFTDYPIQGNSDSKIIEVDVLCFDRDKYAVVRYDGVEEAVKRGYLYADAALNSRLPSLIWCLLPKDVGGPMRSRRDAHKELKTLRRRKSTSYVLWIGNSTRHTFASLQPSLQLFVHTTENCWLSRNIRRPTFSESSPILCNEDGQTFIMTGRGRPFIKPRRLQRLQHKASFGA